MSPVSSGMGPMAQEPEATMVAPATTGSSFFLASVTATVFGGSRYHQAMGGLTSSPTVISTVPSVPMITSPISGRPALKEGRNVLVLMGEEVSLGRLGAASRT